VCDGDDMTPVGTYVVNGVTSVYHQPASESDPIDNIPYTPTPAPTSNCVTYASAAIFTDGANVTGAPQGNSASVTGSSPNSAPTSGASTGKATGATAATGKTTGAAGSQTGSAAAPSGSSGAAAVGVSVGTMGVAFVGTLWAMLS
jgi:hypothetical protein